MKKDELGLFCIFRDFLEKLNSTNEDVDEVALDEELVQVWTLF